MSKGILITLLIIVVVLAGGWYLISPAFTVTEADDSSPLVVRDSMTTMTAEEKAEFNAAVDSMQDETNSMSDTMPGEARLLSEGRFKPQAHEVEGNALLIQDGDSKVLRFEDFDTINGPNLHIYLASSLSDSDFIDLGKIKATSGNVNYPVPDGIDTNKYDKVLVWCVPFKVLFSYAELS